VKREEDRKKKNPKIRKNRDEEKTPTSKNYY